MPTGLTPRRGALRRIGIGVVAVLAVVGAGAIVLVAGVFWFSARMEEQREQGEAFGASATDTACMAEARARLDASNAILGFRDWVGIDAFFQGCLLRAGETEGFCDGVPEAAGEASRNWLDAACPREMDQYAGCVVLHGTLQLHCAGWLPE